MPMIDRVLDDVLASARIPVQYQPLVELTTLETVGFEALARPPEGVTFVDLLQRALDRGEADRLDWICRAAALADPGIDRLPGELAWFVNAEPRSLLAPRPSDVALDEGRWERAVVEITERALGSDPVGLLRGVQQLRGGGAGIALDDVGEVEESLALLAVVAPDVVKLDRAVLEPPDDPFAVRVVDAVSAYAERSGAAVLVEGIENEEHLTLARTAGATHIQGFLVGRPGPLPTSVPVPSRPVPRHGETAPVDDHATPFGEVGEGVAHGVATHATMAAITRHLESQVEHHREPLALLATFQDGDQFGEAVEKRYRELADQYAFVAVFGPGLPDLRHAGIERGDIADGDDLLHEWNIVVIGPHYGVALCSRDTGRGRGSDREFEYFVTHDRTRVERAARVLGHRLTRPH
ncbi:sensor domain-containing phosphodiesterase [Jatrophihabitans sp. YIM 134969]